MATVYLATDRRYNRRVALKVLRPELTSVVGSERFAREIALVARLSHPHILPIFDSGTLPSSGDAPVPFYTMPYIPGQSLRQRLDTVGQLPIEEAMIICRRVAEALQHAHEQGIVHRDIKPENILLPETGALVADFGIARALDAASGPRLTETGLVLGTPAYMSPEQGTGTSRLDGRADIYALGCVLYEMLAGEPPFTGPTAQAVMARHAVDPVPSLRTVRPDITAGLSRVVRRALAKVPADRYQTAQAFADALAEPDSTSADEARTPTDWVKRKRRWLLAGACGIAGIAIFLTTRSRGGAEQVAAADPTVVAVAPFRVTAPDPALGYLREGLVDLLASKLGGTLAIRPVDSRTQLGAWREAGADLPQAKALAVAAGLGAGQLIEGELAGRGSRVILSAALRRVPDGREVTRLSVEGPSDSLTALIDRLAAQLLARAAGEPEERLPALAATSSGALRAYLDGWMLIRRNRWREALRSFQTALATDSAFALAALGATRAYNHADAVRDAPEIELAWRLRGRLTPGDAAHLAALVGPNYPEASTPPEMLEAAERLVRLSPNNADGWLWYGVRACITDAPAPALCREIARRSLELDSLNAHVSEAAADIYRMLGDTTDLRRAIRLHVRVDSVSPTSVFNQWVSAVSLGDSAAARRLALSDSMISTDGLGPLWRMIGTFYNEGVGFSDVEAALRRTRAVAPAESMQEVIDRVEYHLAVMRGRADGLPQPPRWPESFKTFSRVMDALFVGADTAGTGPLIARLEGRLGTPMDEDCCLEQFAAGESALEGGRLSVVRRAIADIRRFPGEARVFELILAAQLAARERSPAAVPRLRQLDSALVDWRDYMQFSLDYGNLIAARLHEERGDYEAALRAVRRPGNTGPWRPVITYHREEGRIAAQAGDTAGAIRAYRLYLSIRGDAGPRLQPEVRQVRAELAALTRSR
jgi:serine/threonine-protein kinase